MRLVGEVNDDSVMQLQDELFEHIEENGNKPVDLWINSGGGSLVACLYAADLILNSPVPIRAICCGGAFSAASVIFIACHERWISPNSTVMLHTASSSVDGPIQICKDSLAYASDLDAKSNLVITERTLVTPALLRENIHRDWYIGASECVTLGIAHKIGIPIPQPKKRRGR